MLRTISGDSQAVDKRTLVNACLRMKGLATSIDLHSLSFETKLLSQKQAEFWSECMLRLSKIEEVSARVLQSHREMLGRSPTKAGAPARARTEFCRQTAVASAT